jgi:deoxyribonuclease-4
MLTYGARMKEEDAIELGKRAKKHDIFLSVHGPYYVVLTSDKQKVIRNSINEMIRTMRLSNLMQAERIVLHPGFGRDINRFIKNIRTIEKDKPESIRILPETMGRLSQLGSLSEVLEICEQTECIPCIDFGHLHARTQGSLKEKEDFRKILVEIEKRLGKKALKTLHCHFYQIEFTEKGEKRHKPANEKNAYPKFEPLAGLIREFNMFPVLISESMNSQDIGALQMKKIMQSLKKFR